jgi:hypothetical protein
VILHSDGLSWNRVRVPRVLSRTGTFLYGLSAFVFLADYFNLVPREALVPVPLFFIASYILSLKTTSVPGDVEIGASWINVTTRGRTTQILRSRIVSALVVERPTAGRMIQMVEMELVDGDRLVVRVEDRAMASACIEALGFGPNGARARVSLATRKRRLLHPALALFAFLAPIIAGTLLDADHELQVPALYFLHTMLVIGLYRGLKRLTRPATITIGDDGIVIERARRRVIPRRDIAAVSRVKYAPLFITLLDGSHVRVAGLGIDFERLDAVGRLIDARHGPSTAPPESFAAFERGGASLAEWKDRIRGAVESTGDRTSYRTAGSPIEDAAEIVRSPHATPDQRIGAALALRIAGEPPDRIRVAAAAVIDDGVRGALEAIADDDDDRAESALRRARLA